MKKIIFLIVMLNLFQQISFSQDRHLIDTLEFQLKNHNTTKTKLRIKSPSLYDTIAANILIRLAAAYTTYNNCFHLTGRGSSRPGENSETKS